MSIVHTPTMSTDYKKLEDGYAEKESGKNPEWSRTEVISNIVSTVLMIITLAALCFYVNSINKLAFIIEEENAILRRIADKDMSSLVYQLLLGRTP